MQNYIYHMVPNDMKGSKLIPLNSLKEKHPNLYHRYTQKYLDHPERAKLLKRHILELDCLWNDVLHFLPLHPYHVYEAITRLGVKTKENQQFFKIPIDRLKNNKSAIYFYSKKKYRGPAANIEKDEIKLLNVQDFVEMTELPLDTSEQL